MAKTDLEIAQETKLEPIAKVAAKIGIPEEALEPYGKYKGKLSFDYIRELESRPEGKLILEDLPKVNTKHEDYFTNYVKASRGEEEFLIKIPQTRRVLKLMDTIRESARTGKSIDFE